MIDNTKNTFFWQLWQLQKTPITMIMGMEMGMWMGMGITIMMTKCNGWEGAGLVDSGIEQQKEEERVAKVLANVTIYCISSFFFFIIIYSFFVVPKATVEEIKDMQRLTKKRTNNNVNKEKKKIKRKNVARRKPQ